MQAFPGEFCMCFVSRLTPCPAGDCFFACPAGSKAQLLAAGCLLAAIPLRDSWCPVGAVPPRMGRNPCGENLFFFCGEAEVFYLAVGFCLLGWGIPLAGKPPFHLPARRGPKPLFLFREKKTAVLDSEKEKVDQWKSWGGAVQQDRLPVLRCCSSGEILWDIVLLVGGPGLSDSWSPLRHCR